MRWEIITDYPNAGTEKKWFDFMPVSTYPSHYTSPGFFIEPLWENQNPFAVLVFDEDEIAGVLTGLHKGTKIICGLEVRPQVSIAENGDSKAIGAAFAEALLTKAKNNGELINVNYAGKIGGFEEAGFSVKKAAGTYEVMMLDLSDGADAVFKNFSQSRRSDLRKAMRENKIRVSQVENLEELAEFYEIHVAWCGRKQNAPGSWEMMKQAYSQTDYQRIFIAKYDGKIIAGSHFRFYRKSLIEYSANHSIPEYQRLRPNDLIVWKSIEWACEQRIPRYSMGGSHLFLRRFGGAPVSSYRYQLDLTFFKKHRKKEAVTNFAIKTYQSLPVETRRKIKKILGKE
ncbi:MAG TPA: GNAT family N-acetyltransferase [Pyrinomonadaceae bacterium]|nr:GNAT family N-acetyltransferase [Pyrinomonadaceae bacterium]